MTLTVLDNHRHGSTIGCAGAGTLPSSCSPEVAQGEDAMRSRVAMVTMCLCSVVAGAAEAQKGKPAPQPTVVNWRCDVVMRDASEGAGDAIRSDGAGEYVDGAGGFICSMSPMASAELGNPAPGSGNFYLDRRPARSFYIPARTGAWAAATDKVLQIRVFNLVEMPVGIVQTRGMAIPTSAIGAMYADNLGGSDLVTVTRTDACTWEIAFDSPEATVQRYKSLDRRVLIDTPQLPLGYTLTTRAPEGSTISECPPEP
jgi:hypothetical protein